MTVLEARECTKRFRSGKVAVFEANLTVNAGTFALLRGPSGSGKTTLLSMLAGLTTPTSGEVLVCGESLFRLRDHHRTAHRRRHLGLVFQDAEFLSRATLLENVLLPTLPLGGPVATSRASAMALLDRFGLAGRAGDFVDGLSGGERQRVCLARALILKPTALLLDEPSSHLDGGRTRELCEWLVTLAREGTAVLAATHDPRMLDFAGVGTVIAMTDGRVEAT